MAKLPYNTKLNLILEGKEIEARRGKSIGFSQIGKECAADLWYSFRWASPLQKFTKRTQRIFDRGDIEEPRIIADLKEAGLEVFRRDPETNEKIEIFGNKDEQEEFVGFANHARGYPDGRVLGVPLDEKTEHVFEAKTMKDTVYKRVTKTIAELGGNEGLLQENRTYYGQVQRVMLAAGLPKTLYVLVNKNDESRYYFIVEFDQSYAEDLVRKEEYIIQNQSPMPPAYPKGHWKCNYCPHIKVCQLGATPEKNCRTCEHSRPADNGVWLCKLKDKELSIEDQIKGCELHKRLF